MECRLDGRAFIEQDSKMPGHCTYKGHIKLEKIEKPKGFKEAERRSKIDWR